MICIVLAITLAAPFPLPAVDGKPLSVTEGQKVFRLPMKFETVKKFYLEQLGPEANAGVKSVEGKRVMTLSAKGKAESWTKAVVREGEVETVIEVTPVMRLGEEQIAGNARPLVEFVIGRSGEVDKAIKSLDHADQMRAR